MKKQVDILLIEDRPEDAELTKIALESHLGDLTIQWIDNGEGALRMLTETALASMNNQSTLPRMILLDLKMNGIDGFEVLQAIRKEEQLKFIPVIILTTSCEISDIQLAYSSGANSYIVKPVNFDRFKEMIEKVGNYWLQLNKTPES